MRVVNIKIESCTHYCGRQTSYRMGYGINCSMFGNPFLTQPSGPHKRGTTISMYAAYIERHRQMNSKLWQQLVALPEDAKLGCFCTPRVCHCDVIKNAWEWAHGVTPPS